MTSPTRPGDALSETQRRFLAAVLERLPRDLVHEVYLFAPMKQGGVETGIAVVAIGEAPAPDAGEVDADAIDTDAIDADASDADAVYAEEIHAEAGDADSIDAHATDSDATDADAIDDDTIDADAIDDDTIDADAIDDDTIDADATDDDAVDVDPAAGGDVDSGEAGGEDADARPIAAPRPARFTIHTARYRLQLKGPERGRWDVDVVEEADAPLVTVDAVVRGVHRRSGEPSEVERLAPHDLARALGEIPWTSEN